MKGSTGRPASGWLEEHLKYTRKRLKRSETPAVDPKVEEEETCDVDKCKCIWYVKLKEYNKNRKLCSSPISQR